MRCGCVDEPIKPVIANEAVHIPRDWVSGFF